MHMDGRFNNPFISEQEDHHQQQQSPIATNSSSSYSPKFSTSMSSPKKGRRAVQKRVVSVPIGEIDGSRCKGEGAPPSDSWAWRKYGQKPIKGSPFPRGYYRCSSSKGCPARKQVERSRLDPSMLLITYACEHNHPWPASKRSNPTTTSSAATTTSPPTSNTTDDTSNDKLDQEESPVFTTQSETKPDDKFPNLGEDSMMTTDDFGWFSDVASTSLTILESPIYSKSSINGEQDDLGLLRFPNMREEDESLFADLGELPECSLVFRRGYADQEEERRRCNLRAASWCGSTG